MFRYETHLHTYPVSRCAQVGVRETLDFYKNIGYQGVFITNHFLDGNINIDSEASFEEKIEFYFSDFEEGKKHGKDIELDVFCGIEMSYKGTDFLIYGLDKEWWLERPEIMLMKKSDQLPVLASNGALVIQAHPFRNASYLDHIRLFPDSKDMLPPDRAICTNSSLHCLQFPLPFSKSPFHHSHQDGRYHKTH